MAFPVQLNQCFSIWCIELGMYVPFNYHKLFVFPLLVAYGVTSKRSTSLTKHVKRDSGQPHLKGDCIGYLCYSGRSVEQKAGNSLYISGKLIFSLSTTWDEHSWMGNTISLVSWARWQPVLCDYIRMKKDTQSLFLLCIPLFSNWPNCSLCALPSGRTTQVCNPRPLASSKEAWRRQSRAG